MSDAGGPRSGARSGEVKIFSAPLVERTGKGWGCVHTDLLTRRYTGNTGMTWRDPRHLLMAKLSGPSGRYQTRVEGDRSLEGTFQGPFLSLFPADRLVTSEYWGQGDGTCTAVLIDPNAFENVPELQGRSTELVLRDHFEDPLLWAVCAALREECGPDRILGPLYAESLGVLLVVHLLRNYSNLRPALLPSKAGLPPLRLRRVLDHIARCLHETTTVADLAVLAGMSPSHFIRCFKHSVGVPPHQYVLQQRVERAKRQLSETRLPLADIAVQCGFSDQPHLTAAFRRVAGTTPMKFRRAAS